MITVSKQKLFLCITKSDWGGAQKYVFDIATNAPKDQFDTTVMLGSDGALNKKLNEAGIRTIILKNSQRDISILKEFGLFFELIKIFKKEKPDIIHLNSSKMGGTGAFAARLVGIKKIFFTAHGWAFNEDRNFLQKFIIKILHNTTILLSYKTIAVSNITKQQISGFFQKKIVVIKNGLREIELKDKESAQKYILQKILQTNPKASYTFSKKPLWIGTISELHKNKGLNFVIDTICKIKENIVFIIIGEGEKRKELEEQIIKLGLSNKVFLVGYVDSASTYLKAVDIFTLTSTTEALPYVLLEAGYASIPVIATNVGGITEIIENKKTGLLIPSKSSEEIRHSIEYFIKNPSEKNRLGDSLNNKILIDFTQKEMLEKTFALYIKVI
jgi:glycosyltransferase involved in cell wall biosynthesis